MLFLIMCIYVCRYKHVSVGTIGGQERVSDSLELYLQVVVPDVDIRI